MRIPPMQIFGSLLLAVGLLAPLPAAAQGKEQSPSPDSILSSPPILTDLGSLSNGTSTVTAINDRGQAVGASSSAHGDRAVLWQNGQIVELPTLGSDSMAMDINNRGQIVGWSRPTGASAHAVLWENGAIQDLGLFKVGEDAFAAGINEAGQIIGGSLSPSSKLPWGYPFSATCLFWDHGVMTQIHSLGEMWCQTLDINNSGQVLGKSDTPSTSGDRSFVWGNNVTTDLGSLGGEITEARDINNRGQVVGAAPTAAGQWHAFLWDHGIMTDLEPSGGAGSEAAAINDAGTITGGIIIPHFGWHAALWQQGRMVDIGRTMDPDTTTYGRFINDEGQVVAGSESPALADPLDQIRQGLLWDKGTWSRLGALRAPAALNARGQVVGNGPISIESTTVTRAWLWQPGLAGLTLWNQLASQVAVEHSVYGPGGTFGRGSFVPDRDRDVYSASFDELAGVAFPSNVVNGPRGAIHFWAKMTGFPTAIAQGPSPSLAGIRDSAGSYYGLEFSANDLGGNGGLCAAAGSSFTACTGDGTGSAQLRTPGSANWTYADALGSADPAQWHHYALVWDEDGILGIGDGTAKVAALVDDNPISQHLQNAAPFQMNDPLDGQLSLLNANSGLEQGSVQYADLSVWSYARLDTAELPLQIYLPKVAKSQ